MLCNLFCFYLFFSRLCVCRYLLMLSLFWSVFFGNMFVSVCFSVPNSIFFDFSSSYVHQFPSSLDPSKFCFCPLFQSKILVSVKDFWPWSNIFSSVNVFFIFFPCFDRNLLFRWIMCFPPLVRSNFLILMNLLFFLPYFRRNSLFQ